MSVARGEDPWLLQGTEWPLLFSYRMVTGYQGTPIKIELSGRATAHVNQEDGTVWIDGVNPGSFASFGNDMENAERDLRETLTGIFSDIAADSNDFPDFENQARDFLFSTDDDTVAEWEAALLRVRRSTSNGAPGLPRRSADDNPPRVKITRHSSESSDTPLLLTNTATTVERVVLAFAA